MSEAAQVLEFELGDEQYCVDIQYVAEIVDMGELTPVPNSPSHVEGVMDLRGRTTSIVDPKSVLDVDAEEGNGERVVVFDPDVVEEGGAVGWIVDDVDRVIDIDPADVDEPPSGEEAVEGIVTHDGEFIVWVRPEAVN